MPSPASIPSSAEVVVIGGGVVGASVARALARRGVRDVVVLDRATGPGAGDGSTARATGGYRAQFTAAINVRLSLLARDVLRRFAEETGVDAGYRPVGYLFLAHDDATFAVLAAAQSVQRGCGLAEARMLGPDEARACNPLVRLEGAVGAAWCPTDGTIRPLQILRGFREDAERHGVRFVFDAPVTRLVRDAGGRVTHVEAAGTRVACGHVVNAAGAWAAQVAAMAGVTLPVVPVRRQVCATTPLETLDDDFPMTIWTKDAFHLRVRDGRALLNWPVDTPAARPDALTIHEPWVDATWAMAQARVPALARATLDRSATWAGLYEMTPDRTVILDVAPGCPNLVLVNGSSGHGVMHSPALGPLAAELLLDGRTTTLDTTPLRLSRFTDGAPHPSHDVL